MQQNSHILTTYFPHTKCKRNIHEQFHWKIRRKQKVKLQNRAQKNPEES